MKINKLLIATGIGFLSQILTVTLHAAPIAAGEPIPLPGTQGKFDFIRIDTAANRLLLGHAANKSFDVFDIATGKLLKIVPTGTAQDAAVNPKGFYYVSGNDPGRMVIVDSNKLEVAGEVPMKTDTDLIAFNPRSGMVYEDNDKAGEIWVVDPSMKSVVATIKVNGKGVEDMAFDTDYKHLYQAVKGAHTIAVIDPANNQVTAEWPLAPDKGPHGIAFVPEINGLLVACAGKLVLIDCVTGKITATAAIATGVDEMAYDPGLHIAYCSSRQGKISSTAVEAGKLTPLGDVADEPGTGDIAVDPKTHTVWIAYANKAGCFVQPFTVSK